MVRRVIPASLVAICAAAAPAAAQLNQFDFSDGYMGAFATPVWTYHPQWSFSGGTVGSNYVAQHGYGVGGAFGAPFGLVVRNDTPASNYRFAYNFTPFDVGGANPAAISGPGSAVTISFDVQPVFFQNSSVNNNAAMLTMGFGGTAASPGVRIGFSDDNYLMYSDALGNFQTFGTQMNGFAWSRLALTIHFDTSTYDLSYESLQTVPGQESNTFLPFAAFTVATGAPLMNALTELQTLHWETFTDPENNLGWHKGFFDNFGGRYVPAPGTLALAAMGLAVGARRRR
jgi:hypothetical protein